MFFFLLFKQSHLRFFLFCWIFGVQYRSKRIHTVPGKKTVAEKLYLSIVHQPYISVCSHIHLQSKTAICSETSLSFLFFSPLHQKRKVIRFDKNGTFRSNYKGSTKQSWASFTMSMNVLMHPRLFLHPLRGKRINWFFVSPN